MSCYKNQHNLIATHKNIKKDNHLTDTVTRKVNLDFLTSPQLKTMLGEYNNHLKYIQDRLDITITQRQHKFTLSGDLTAVERADVILNKLADEAQTANHITPEELHLIIQSSMSRVSEAREALKAQQDDDEEGDNDSDNDASQH